MLAATAVLENGWKPNMTEEEAKKLVRDAIAAGIINDMGSGSNVDLAIIKPNDDCKVRYRIRITTKKDRHLNVYVDEYVFDTTITDISDPAAI